MMEPVIYGENRILSPGLFVSYVAEIPGEPEMIEIYRQVFTFQPRYERGDVIKFRNVREPKGKETRYIVDRVVHYIINYPHPPEKMPPFQNHIYVILRQQQLSEGSELPIRKLKGQFDTKLPDETEEK